MRIGALLALGILVALGFADYATLVGTQMAETTFDSGIFLRCAESSLLDPEFYSAVRPPTVPLLYKLVGSDVENIRILQSALSVLCWWSLGLALASLVAGRWSSLLVLLGTCAFSLSSPINQWDGVVMSESLFLSLLVATIALSIFAARAMVTLGRLPALLGALWFLVSLLFAGSRDSAVYFLVVPWLAGAALFVSQLVRGRSDHASSMPRGTLLKALTLGLAIMVASQLSLHSSKRWQTPLLNVILHRVLPDEELYELWIERYDLPRDPLLEGQANQYAWDRVGGALQLRKMIKPRYPLSAVGEWLRTRGVSSYQRHLLVDEPGRSLVEAVQGLELGVNPEPPVGPGEREKSYSRGAGITSWSQALTRVTYVELPGPLWICLGVALLVLVAGIARVELRAPAVCVLLLLAGAAAQAFVTWHGDAAEVPRHTLVVGVLVRVALGLALVVLLSALRRRGYAKATSQATTISAPAAMPETS